MPHQAPAAMRGFWVQKRIFTKDFFGKNRKNTDNGKPKPGFWFKCRPALKFGGKM
jgi:hypothetical protein